jgi:hypothetical protein
MEAIHLLLQSLANSKFYGALVLKFEAGKIVLLRKEETIKPQHYGDNRREYEETRK